MTWRTIILTNESKISLRMNHLIISCETTTTVPLDEMGLLLIENPNISLTGHILNALAAKKITTIICDRKHDPSIVVHPVYGHHRQAQRIKEQIDWSEENKAFLWKEIVKQKIINQQKLIDYFDLKGGDSFTNLINDVQMGDETNREAVAAKQYFIALFGNGFVRMDEDVRNWGLNYGYAILQSLFSRQIVGKGLLTELGIHHSNASNQYNLASDFMEIYRPIVDFVVYQYLKGDVFEKGEKRKIIKIVEFKIWMKDKQYYLEQNIQLYVEKMIEFLKTGDSNYLVFPNLDFAKYY